jgi:adenylosuccinate lyase
MEDLIHQISQLKEKMPGLQLLEHEFDNMKRDISSLKGELMTLRDRSSKAIKRESIAAQINKRDSSAKLGRSSILNQGSMSPVLNEIDNKENKSNLDGKDFVGRVDTNISQSEG